LVTVRAAASTTWLAEIEAHDRQFLNSLFGPNYSADEILLDIGHQARKYYEAKEREEEERR
jgi:hypothetical protein